MTDELKIEAQIVFYNPKYTELNDYYFANYIRVRDDGYWEYIEKLSDKNFHSLYLRSFSKYSLDDYCISRKFYIVLTDIENKNFGYRIKFSISLLALELYQFDGCHHYPLRSEKWVCIRNQELKPHQLEQLETFINEKSVSDSTKYIISFGEKPALLAAEIIDTLDDEDIKGEYLHFGDDYPRQVSKISLVGDIHFQNIKSAEKEAEEKVFKDYANTEFLNPLDENTIFKMH